MANMINLDPKKIAQINQEIISIDANLTKRHLPELQNVVLSIKNNVLSTQINDMLGQINAHIDTVSNELSVALPKLEQFLDAQMKAYAATEAQAIEKIKAALSKMAQISMASGAASGNAGSTGTTTGNNNGSTGTTTGAAGSGAMAGAAAGAASGAISNNSSSSSKKKQGFWSFHGDNFADAWTTQDWAGAWDYSQCDGLVDAVTTTVDGVVSTVGNVASAVVDTVGATLNFVGDGVSKVANKLFGWIF